MHYLKLSLALLLCMGYSTLFAEEAALQKQDSNEDFSITSELIDPAFAEFYNALTEKEKKEYMDFSVELGEICTKAVEDLDSLVSICEPFKKTRNGKPKGGALTLQLVPKSEEAQLPMATIDEVFKDPLNVSLSLAEKEQLTYALKEATGIGKETEQSIDALCARYTQLKSKFSLELKVAMALTTPTRTYILKA
jgi:hypothetical protein